MERRNLIFVCCVLCIFICYSCSNHSTPLPKPRMYPKIDFPARNYVDYNKVYCPFSFEYPDYATIERDRYFFEDQAPSPCWFDIQYTNFNGTLHCTYSHISNRKNFDKLVADVFNMADQHNIKAMSRQTEKISNNHGVSGILFHIDGEVASKLQVFLTDTTRHFFRASLYFNAKINSDSIAPIYSFVEKDILYMLSSFQWK